MLRDRHGHPVGIVTVNRDITKRKREDARQSFLAEASELLVRSLDYGETLAVVTQLTVQHLADWCMIHLLTEEGTVVRVGVAHKDPTKQALAEEFDRRYRPNRASTDVWPLLLSGQPFFVSVFSNELLTTRITDPTYLQLVRELEIIAARRVPLIVHGRVLGVIPSSTCTAAVTTPRRT